MNRMTWGNTVLAWVVSVVFLTVPAAGIVGERVMRDTGLPKEVVGYAISEAVPGAQRVFQVQNPDPVIKAREAECLPRMRADFAAADAQDAPLPKPQRGSSK